jgi:hypothetical protein
MLSKELSRPQVHVAWLCEAASSRGEVCEEGRQVRAGRAAVDSAVAFGGRLVHMVGSGAFGVGSAIAIGTGAVLVMFVIFCELSG